MALEITVVIPTKDRVDYLRRTLPAFLAQPEVREVIVIIDGSSDGTAEFLAEYCRTHPAVRVVDNGVNRGIPFSRNRGIDEATSEYIFMAEDDLELTEGFFATLSAHMAELGADVMCGRNIFRRDTETAEESIARTNALRGSYVNMRSIEIETSMNIGADQVEPIIASPMLARTALFREVRYDERFLVNFWREETDFQLSARERGYVLGCCPHAVCFNFDIANDRGGVHATHGWRRERWVVINNWRFITKHSDFIAQNFEMGNQRVHIVVFALGRVVKYLVVSPFIDHAAKWKRDVVTWWSSRRR